MRKVLTALAIFMIFPLGFWYINSVWFVEPVVKRNFSEAEITEICEQFKFKILPDETITAEYFPGVMQATTFINITIDNINSESDFLSRFSGKVTQQNDIYNSEIKSNYKVSIFKLDHLPKDYSCNLSFTENSGNISAKFQVIGYIPQLEKVYKFCDDPFQHLLSNWIFMICLGVELILIISIIVHAFICFVRKRTHSNKL